MTTRLEQRISAEGALLLLKDMEETRSPSARGGSGGSGNGAPDLLDSQHGVSRPESCNQMSGRETHR